LSSTRYLTDTTFASVNAFGAFFSGVGTNEIVLSGGASPFTSLNAVTDTNAAVVEVQLSTAIAFGSPSTTSVYFGFDPATLVVIPEPATTAMLLLGAPLLAMRRRAE